ncbi:TPA: LysR substrate-binding domain-containing protein, partial [Serratia marcescens]
RAVGYFSLTSNRDYPLEFCRGGKLELRELPARLSVSGADAYIAGARAGMGLIQAARYSLAPWLEQGELVEVLAETPPPPMPIYIMYPPGRFLAPRVRVLIDWLIWLFDQQKSGDMAVFPANARKAGK